MRKVFAFTCLLACIIAAAPAWATECPGNPNALGISRTIVVDPSEHTRLGSYQYAESLPLADKEVVLTFDDGPLPPYSTRILDILARECLKATFFMVGKMARSFPRIVRRVHEEGHTLANHSQSHPYNFYSMSVLDAAREIEDGFDSIASAVGDPAKVSPFFRFPGLHRQDLVEQYLVSKGQMSWSVDFMGDDWTRIDSREIVRRVLARLESKGKGILMLHDIKPATALGLQDLIDELKARGYRVVHVVVATPDRPKTATTAAEWQVAHPPTAEQLANREPSMWPRVAPYRIKAQEIPLQTPSPTSFGVDAPDAGVPVALVATPEVLRNGNHDGVLAAAWPNQARITTTLPEAELLPIPAVDNFRYTSTSRKRAKREKGHNGRSTRSASRSATSSDITGSVHGSGTSGPESKSIRSGKPRHFGRHGSRRQTGHQIQLPQPTARLEPRR